MAKRTYPYTPRAGRLAGRTFTSDADYKLALAETPASAVGDGGISSRSTSSPTKPKLQYSRGMVEAVVKMIEGGLSFLPLFRGPLVGEGDDQHFERAINSEEHDWLVNDWYAFGKRHPFFARLIVQMFTVDLYGQLVLDHVLIVGSRLVAVERLPQAAIFPLQMAYIMRQTMAGEIAVNVEPEPSPEPEPADLGMEAVGTPGPGGSNGYRENLFSQEAAHFETTRRDAGHEA